MKLIRMPDGTWLRSDYIMGIEAADAVENDRTMAVFVAPRIIVHLQGDRRWYETATFDKACELRDKIAAEVNAVAVPSQDR